MVFHQLLLPPASTAMDGASTTERDGLPVSVTVGMPASAESTAENEVPSCQGCRRRKLRCSREQPICLHCKRLGMNNILFPFLPSMSCLTVNRVALCV